jgi:hypothetical protein
MRNLLSAIMLMTGIVFAQSVMWEKSFPFETPDEGPVGIDITQEGNILVACYANGPNNAYWDSESSSVKGPDTKLLSLDRSGNMISSENFGPLLNGSVAGVGTSGTGYSLFGNDVKGDPRYFTECSAWIIRHNEDQNDTLKNNSGGFTQGFSFQRTKTSYDHLPVTQMSEYYTGKSGSSQSALVDTDNNYLFSIYDMETQFPDSLFYDPSDKWIQSFGIFDFDYNESSEMFIAGSLSGMSLNADYEFIIKLDSEKNVIWQKYYYGYDPPEGQLRHKFSAVSATTDGGCIAGVKSGSDFYVRKFDGEGNESYPISVSNDLDFLHRVGINEFIYREKGSSDLTKIIDTGEGLQIEWASVFPDIKAIRPIDNGFVAAGIKDNNIVVFKAATGTGIEDNSTLPSHHELFQNYPNPFNPVTQIKFALAKTADVKLSVYNISGQLVSQLASGTMNTGVHTVDFDGSKLNSGIYYYTLEVEGNSLTKRMLMIK